MGWVHLEVRDEAVARLRRVGPLSGLPAACAQQRGNVNLPVKFRVRATEPSAEPELSLRATASGARLRGCVGPHRLRDSLRGARTSSSHCRRPHLHFPPLSDPQATTFLSPPGGIYLIHHANEPELNSTQLLGTAPDSAVRIKTQSSKSSIGWLLTGSRVGVEGMRGIVPSTSSKTKRSKCAPTRKYSLPSAEMLKTP